VLCPVPPIGAMVKSPLFAPRYRGVEQAASSCRLLAAVRGPGADARAGVRDRDRDWRRPTACLTARVNM